MTGVAGTTVKANAGTQAGANTRKGQPVTLNLQTALKQARACFEQGKFDDAAKIAVAILTKRPGTPVAVQIVAAVAEKKGKPDRAIEILRSSLTGRKTDAMAQMSLCRLYRVKGMIPEAVAAGEAALSHGASEILTDLGDALVLQGDNERALGMFERAVSSQPDLARAHLSLAHALLMKGDYRSGWSEYEWRYKLKSTEKLLPKFKHAVWNGMELKASTLLIVCEQGYGDCFQYARYIKLAKERVRHVIVGASTELKPLIERIAGPGTVIDRWENLPPFDYQITLSSLPYVFGSTLADLPSQVPYLFPDLAKVEAWKIRLAPFVRGRKTVGLVWHGRPTNAINAIRSVPLGSLTPLLESDDYAVVSLQVGHGAEQLAQHPLKSRVFNAAPLIKDFDDTAALMSVLDRVVTIETASAHLAGALGRKTLVMLPAVADWRWLEKRNDSPWYPSIELIRPKSDGARHTTKWDSVVSQVINSLKKI
ncbi:MAG: tetratricopeptide repeat-containing glycosyltransferase family protein [Micropepsaceae bacterium]